MQVTVFLIYMHKDLHKNLLLNVAYWIILNPFLTPLVWEAVGVHAKSGQTCWTLCDPMDDSPLGSSVPEILQTRILEWVALLSSKGTSSPRGQIHLSHISCIGVSSSPRAPPGSLRGWNTKKKKSYFKDSSAARALEALTRKWAIYGGNSTSSWQCQRFNFLISETKVLGIAILISGEGNVTPLQYSCLENPMDGGAW